jgi:HEAT repeat protein
MFAAATVFVDLADFEPSSVILGTLAGIVVLTVLLYFSGALGILIRLISTLLRVSITSGFKVWQRSLSWAPWPVFLVLTLGLLVLGLHLVDTHPALTALLAAVPLLMGMAACSAYMYIDWERYEVARGYKSVHNPLKGQELAHHLVQYGHRVGVMLLASAAVAVIGGFALLNQGLQRGVGRDWYNLGDLTREFIDFLAYALINIYGIVDLLDLASHRRLLEVPHIRTAAWPASTLLNLYKAFFTLVLLQQLFAAVRNAWLLGATIDDFWSPYQPVHLRARNTLPLYGLAAIGPLLGSLRSRGVLTREQREQLPGILADMGPAIVPVLTTHLRDPQPDVRAVTVAALGQLRAFAALPALLPLTEDPSDFVRQNLVTALGNLGATDGSGARQAYQTRVRLRRARMRLWLRVRWWWQRRRPLGEPLPPIVAALRGRLTDTAPAVRLHAAQALGCIGSAAAAAAGDLRGLVHDGDETVRCGVIEALGRIGAADAATQATLTPLLADGSAAVRRSAARALGFLAAAAALAVPALVEALRDSEESVRQAAAEAISAIGTVPASARDTLVGGLSDPDNLVRAHTARALGEIGSAVAGVAPALVEALTDSNHAVRAEVVEALGKIGPAAADVAVPRIVHALHDPDSWVSALAAEALGAMGESAEEAVPALMRSLGHISPQVRANAAEALGKMGSAAQAARAALVQATADADGSVRCQAVRALGQLRPDESARATLRNALHDADPQVRAAATNAIAQWGDESEDVRNELLRLLDDPNDVVKVQAEHALPRLVGATPDAIDRLSRRLLKDDSVWVQAEAAQALGRLGAAAQAAGAALVEAAQTGDAGVREHALHALALIQPPEAATAFAAGLRDASADIRRMASAGWRRSRTIPEEAVGGLLEALRDPDVAVRTNVACALSRLETLPDAAVPLLLECLGHESAGLRWHATVALQAVPGRTVAGTLQRLLDDPNMSIRLVAARALLTTPTTRAKALAVVAEALTDLSPGYRRAALRLVEILGPGAAELRAALQQQVDRETEVELRDAIKQVLAGLEPPTVDGETALVGAADALL